MTELLFILNVLIVAAFVFELSQSRKERQSLVLLVKSETVHEFVRAEMQLATAKDAEPERNEEPQDIDDLEPSVVLDAVRRANGKT